MALKISQTFNHPKRLSFTDIQGAQKAYDALFEHLKKMAGQLNSQKDDIERGGLGSTTVTQAQAAASLEAALMAGSPLSIQIRNRTESFTANVTKSVVFSSSIGTVFSLSSIRVLDTTGMAVQDFTITNLTAAGFDFLCPVSGTLVYLAVEEV